MSINIPAETPDESTNPISVEEFERLHPAMLGAIRKAVREEPARTVIGTVGGGCHGGIHRIESLGEEGKTLAQGSHPLVGIGRFGGLPKHGARLREIGSIAHILTSLLCVGLLILPLGRKGLK